MISNVLFKYPRLRNNRGFITLCFNGMDQHIKMSGKYDKDKNVKKYIINNLHKNDYLSSYDSLTSFDNTLTKPSTPNFNGNFLIQILCFLSVSTIMYYFYKPRK
jgi:hypothetical protein